MHPSTITTKHPMEKSIYKSKFTQLKSEIHVLSEQLRNLTKGLQKTAPHQHKMKESYFNARYPLKINWLKQIYFHLLVIRLAKTTHNEIEESEIDETRNALIGVLALWEEELETKFLEFYEDSYPVHSVMSNLQVAEHFKVIGFAIDKINFILSEKGIMQRKQVAMLRLRCKFLVTFCNALNFKKLIKDIESMGTTYSSSQDTLTILYSEFDYCIDNLWKYYFVNNQDNFNLLEMRRLLDIINFVKKLSSFLFDKERMLAYKKKYKVWNKYIIKATEEINKQQK
ncbi:hypothetical protein COTS27_01521 [Spirochaetota bacterium]|nr:hypothetical protein COTS27_01521 [Spirochaetota bacterium]